MKSRFRTCLICGDIKAISKTQDNEIKKGTRKSLCISCSQKGRTVSDEMRRKISEKLRGRRCSPSTEFKKGQKSWVKGLKFSPEVRLKMSLSRIGKRGSLSGNWRGGLSGKQSIRKTADYGDWRKKVYQRDGYTCQLCFKRGVKLHAHHIESFSKCESRRLDLENGKTLCIPCHRKIHSRKEILN